MTGSYEKADLELGAAWEDAAVRTLLRHVPLADVDGTVLVAELGNARFAGAVVERSVNARRVMLVDSDPEHLDAARRALGDASVPTFFAGESVRALSFAPDVFDAAFCVRSIITTADALNVVASLTERVRPDGWVGVAALGGASLQVVEELMAEASYAAGIPALDAALADHRGRRVGISDLEMAAERLGLVHVAGGVESVPVSAAPEALIMSSLVAADLAPAWRAIDESIRPPGTTFADAVMRLRTYFGGERADDSLQMVWLVGRVAEPEVFDIGDDDVILVGS